MSHAHRQHTRASMGEASLQPFDSTALACLLAFVAGRARSDACQFGSSGAASQCAPRVSSAASIKLCMRTKTEASLKASCSNGKLTFVACGASEDTGGSSLRCDSPWSGISRHAVSREASRHYDMCVVGVGFRHN
jgi:hypothetical protein